jgi:integrase
MQRQLTDRYCASAKATGPQTDFFDAACTGLALRVFRSGAKSWMYRFSWDGRRKWMMLGTYPATSLARARTAADEARQELEAKPQRDPRLLLAKPETLRAVAAKWHELRGSALRTGADRWAVLDRAVLPVLGDRPVGDIRRSDVARLLDDLRASRGPAAADRALAVLRRVLNWHESRNDDFRSPIVRSMSGDKSPARSRILTDDELRTVWHTAATQGAFGRMVRFLLLTGARRTEAAEMEWSELAEPDKSGTVDWLLPGSRNKTKQDLIRPLSPTAVAVLGERGASPWIFTTDGACPIRGYGELKAAFDAAVTASLGEPLPNWTLHDARRTARSLMSRAGVPTDHAERVLGHVLGGVRQIYDRHDFREEKAIALAKLAQLIEEIVMPPRPKVLTLRRVTRDA